MIRRSVRVVSIFRCSLQLCLISLCAACATTPPVEGVDETKSLVALTCTDYDLTQDCSFFGGARRTVEIDGFAVRVAGSTDGQTVLLMDAKLDSNTFKDFYRLNIGKDFHSTYVNDSYNKVKELLESHDIKIQKIIRLGKLDEIDGYIIVTDGDAYKVLVALSPVE